MGKDLHGAAAHSHQYYTVEKGEYDNNRRAEGAIGLAVVYGIGAVLGSAAGLVEIWVRRRRHHNK